ncbi:MAG: T9SS type A sorting domain-containing protein, partial [Candidatus Delongbacteria bacterium]|nr:T9SS type A sorting domain-containing protein [Candidatus Delongbacteria bacterium]
YIVTSKNSAQMTAVPSFGIEGESFIIEHSLGINSIFCYSNQYPIYTANFLIGTDQGVYLATGFVGIEDQENTTIASTLYQNYPNPFNPETTISYSLVEEAEVKLTVFNMAGREVAELVSVRQAKGNHSVNFNGENLTSGLYFYRLSVDGKQLQSKKMMILK